MLAALLASRAPVTFQQLQAALGDASRTTTFHYLKQVRHLRSYNHNGRYYTHRDPLRFDCHGLVSLGDIHFSRDGTLGATVLRLVRESATACTHKELQALLHVPVHAFLLAAVRRQALHRERMAGVWVYRSSDPARGAAQRRARQARFDPPPAAAWEPTVIREVLLALIRHPGASPVQLARRLQGHAPPIALSQVAAVFARFDLAQVESNGRYGLLQLLWEQARAAGRPGAGVARAHPRGAALLTVDFPAEQRRCPRCDSPLQTQKSKTRRVVTLITGEIQAREIRKHCAQCPRPPVAVSAQLAALVPPRQRYGYDLIAWVGLARYHRHRQRREIRADLARQGIRLADGSVSALCDRFLRLLEALHRARVPALRAAMAQGYPLHIDATSDKGRGALFLCLDGWRNWVLHAVKVSTENAAEMRPAIPRTVADFGPPVAIMRDLGSAGAKAVKDYRQQAIPDLVCHYHFLAAAGRKLLDVEYAALRSQLRSSKVRSGLRDLLRASRGRARLRADLPALLLWVLEGEGRKDLPYPFALAHWEFYRRCAQFPQRAQRWLPRPRSRPEQGVLRQAEAVLAGLQRRDRLAWAVPRLERSWAAFSALRDVLRLRDDELPRGDRRTPLALRCPARAATRLQAIETVAKAYHARLRERVAAQPARGPAAPDHRPEAVVLQYLDRYSDGLFGHPVARDADGRILAVVDRTNNVAEHFFATSKQQLRRRLGRAHLGRDMEDQPAQAALAANLRDPEYVRIVCGSLDHLPQAFAALDREAVAATTPLQRNNKDAALRQRIRAWAADYG